MYQKLAILKVLTILAFSTVNAQEICNNGIDDNANGLVDLNDPQCGCTSLPNGPVQSLIPNPSFEDMLCCPFTVSQINCATSWTQVSDGTIDYYNTCNLWWQNSSGGLFPFPDGEGAVGMFIVSDAREYIGSCLVSPMQSGISYTLQMDIGLRQLDPGCLGVDYIPFDMTIFGAPTCGNMPYPGWDCPPAPFVPIGSVSYDPITSWQTISFTFIPTFDVAEIIIGASCILPANFPTSLDPCSLYLLADNLILNASNAFSVQLSGNLCDNNAVLNVSSVLPGGTWQWYEDGVAIAGQTNPTLNVSALALGGGNYTASFTDSNECVSASLSVPDAEPFSIAVNSETICAGSSTTLTVTGTNGFCSWSPATGLNTSSGLSVQASPTTTTSYTVTATANGCTATAISLVTVDPEIVIDVNNETTCPAGNVTLTATGATSYNWSPTAGLNVNTGPIVTATVNTTTIYTVTGTSGNCSGTAQATVTIENDIPMSISASPNPVKADYPFVQFHGEPSNESLFWQFDDLDTATGSEVTHEFPSVESTYDVLLIAHTSEGCIDSMYITVVVQNGLMFYVPNAFTPDGNEYNNIFLPFFSSGYDPANYELVIFNRWGETVFETKDISKGWDGSYDGYMAPDGEYTWSIIIKSDNSDERSKFNGHFNLLR